MKINNTNGQRSTREILDDLSNIKLKSLQRQNDNLTKLSNTISSKPIKEDDYVETVKEDNISSSKISYTNVYNINDEDSKTIKLPKLNNIINSNNNGIDEINLNILSIKEECNEFRSDIKEISVAHDKLISNVKRLKETVFSNVNYIKSITIASIAHTIGIVIMAIIMIFLIISNISLRSSLSNLQDKYLEYTEFVASTYYSNQNNNESGNTDNSVKYEDSVDNTNNSNNSTSNFISSDSYIEDESNEGLSSDNLEEKKEEESETAANNSTSYDVISSDTKTFTGKFKDKVITTNSDGTVNYSVTAVDEVNGFEYVISGSNISLTNQSTKKEARQYEIVSSMNDSLVDTGYRCQITLSVNHCTDNKVRYLINTYKGIR